MKFRGEMDDGKVYDAGSTVYEIEKGERMIFNALSKIVSDTENPPSCGSGQRCIHEIEGRLGNLSSSGFFSPGVDPQWFEALCRRLNYYSGWKEETQWVESEDTTFNINSGQVRQQRSYDSNDCVVTIKANKKTPIHHTFFRLPLSQQENEHILIDSGANVIKVAYSMEENVCKNKLPNLVDPLHVRIKQRREFTIDSNAILGAKWRFDLTRTWSGKTHEQAETQQRNADPVCEVELEWIPPDDATCQKMKQVGLEQMSSYLFKSLTDKLFYLRN